jgi:hypothetical protein
MLEIHQCGVNNCSHVVITSSTPQLRVSIPYIQIAQGRREFGSGAISAEDLLKIADIPALDFSADFPEFCMKTVDYINNYVNNGTKPNQWQRPTDVERIEGAAQWLDDQGDNSMPDGILIGQRDNNINYLKEVDLHSRIGGFDIYQLVVVNELLDRCPTCGNFIDDEGKPVFRNRCDNHDCDNHQTTTSPFNIIDGQHRSMSIYKSSLEKKQMVVSILLQHSKYQNCIGYSNEDQALIFNQVNTENSELDNLHKTWLKRFFGPWAVTPNLNSNAFDLLAQLGMISPGSGTNPWAPYVKLHPKSGKYRIDSNRATDAGTGNIDGMSSMSSIINQIQEASVAATAASGVVRSGYDIMVDWLRAAIDAFPNQFTLPNTAEFLDSQRPFEAFLRVFGRIKEHVQVNPNFSGTYSYEDFLWSFSQHIPTIETSDWKNYKKGGEQPWKEFLNILKLIWPNAPQINLPDRPTWFTVYSGGSFDCPSWNSYIGLTPDPIEDYSDITKNSPDSIVVPGGNLSVLNNRFIKSPRQIISWSRPRNVAEVPDIHYRVYDPAGNPGQWLKHGGGLTAEDVTNDTRNTYLILRNARDLIQEINIRAQVLWDLRIRYSNVNGETSVIICYISA